MRLASPSHLARVPSAASSFPYNSHAVMPNHCSLNTALWKACEAGEMEQAKALRGQGADPNCEARRTVKASKPDTLAEIGES